MTNKKSFLDPRLYGLVYVTGLYGTGKTTFATTCERPDLTAIIDFDLKFKAEAERLGFWYRSPDHTGDVFNFDFKAMTNWFRQAIAEIPDGTTTVVIDNAGPLEGLLGYIVSNDPAKYGVNPANARSGSYGGVNPGIGKLWKNIASFLQNKGVQVVFVVGHVGSPWMNGQPVPNKFRGKGNKAIQELANLSVVLVKTGSPIPAGIVLKEQLAQRVFTEDGWEVKRVLPLRFPKATWKEIRRYFDNPADFANPQPGEVPTQQELDMYGELFTLQQIEFIQAVASGEYTEDGDAPQYAEPEQPKEEPKTQPAKPTPNGHANGNGKQYPKRPWSPECLKAYLAERIADLDKPGNATDKQIKAVVSNLNSLLNGDNIDTKRHIIMRYLTGKESASDLTVAEASKLIEWTGCKKETEWQPNADSVDEAKAILEEVEFSQEVDEKDEIPLA